MRPGVGYTLGAIAIAGATGFTVTMTATAQLGAATRLVIAGLVLFGGAVLLGTSRWLNLASLPMLGAVVVEAAFGDRPFWIRSVIIGCMWFAAVETGWEAIDRRDGARRTVAANARRIQEVVVVIGIALLLGLLAGAASSVTPVRSVLLEAVVLVGLLAGFVTLVRDLTEPQEDEGGGQP